MTNQEPQPGARPERPAGQPAANQGMAPQAPYPRQPGAPDPAQSIPVPPLPASPGRRVSFFEAIKPDPAKAPPLEWVALATGLILAVSGVLPWIFGSNNTNASGLDYVEGTGDGFIVLGAGLLSVVLGFFGLSRDSISLAVGQALIGLIALIFSVINIFYISDRAGSSIGFGLILAIISSVVLVGLSVYNAFDANRKGAAY